MAIVAPGMMVRGLLLGALLAPAATASPPAPWIEARAGHVRVISNGPADDAVRLLERLQHVRRLVERSTGLAAGDAAEPLTVLAPKDRTGMREIVGDAVRRNPGLLVAAALPSPYGNHLAVRIDARQAQQTTLLLHEYLHVVSKAALGDVPAWLDEGLSEFWSTLQDARGTLVVGAPIEQHVRTLRRNQWIPLRDLVSVPRGGYDRVRGGLPAFYAQSWALVHFLFGRGAMAPHPYAPTVPDDVVALDAALQAYARGPLRATAIAPRQNGPVRSEPLSVRTLSEAEALAIRAGILVYGDRPDAAAGLASLALALEPGHPLALEAMGISHFLGNRPDEAKAWLGRAVGRPSAGYRAHYYYAVLNMGTPSVAVLHLKRALELRPNFAPAQERLRETLQKSLARPR